MDLIDVKIEKRNSNNYMLGPTIMSETKFSHVSKHLKERSRKCVGETPLSVPKGNKEPPAGGPADEGCADS